MVHEEVEGLFFPGTAGVLVAAQAAQQLDAGSVAGGVVSTAGGSIKKQKKHSFSATGISSQEREVLTGCIYKNNLQCGSCYRRNKSKREMFTKK